MRESWVLHTELYINDQFVAEDDNEISQRYDRRPPLPASMLDQLALADREGHRWLLRFTDNHLIDKDDPLVLSNYPTSSTAKRVL